MVFLQKRLLSRPELLLFRRSVRTLVFDFDDAIMFDETGRDDPRRQARFAAMMRAADLVICGNQFLADEASRETPRVTIVPTCIDTAVFTRGFAAVIQRPSRWGGPEAAAQIPI